MTEQRPNYRKSALKAILLEAIVLGLALIFLLVASITPQVGNVSYARLTEILFGISIVLGIGVGIFIVVLLVESGKFNVAKIPRFDSEKVGKIFLLILMICGIIVLIDIIASGGVVANLLWGAYIVGVVGIGLLILTFIIGILWFLSLFQQSPVASPAEKPLAEKPPS